MASTVMLASPPPPRQHQSRDADGAMTRQQVAQHFGVTCEDIRQIELKALRKLREHLQALGESDAAFARPSGEQSTLAGAVRESRESSGRDRHAATESAAMEREADAWADHVLALRLDGVPLPVAWSAANGCPLAVNPTRIIRLEDLVEVPGPRAT